MAPDQDKKQLQMDWYTALAEEDCVKVRKLLDAHNSLLYDGWRPDARPSVQVEQQIPWQKRTALHVAARRGCCVLTKLIQTISQKDKQDTNRASVATGQEQGGKSAGQDSIEAELLKAIDGDYDLDALAMAVINGNKILVRLLTKMSLECATNPYEITNEDPEDSVSDEETNDKVILSRLIKKVMDAQPSKDDILDMYRDDCDFNFLDWELYLFHFTFSTFISEPHLEDIVRPVQLQILYESKRNRVEHFLLFDLQDGQGRTALHVAVDSQKVSNFLHLIPKEEDNPKYLNVRDGAGRTPLYRAAAEDLLIALGDLLEDPRTDINAGMNCSEDYWGKGLDVDKLSWRNGFKSDCVYISSEKLNHRNFFNNETYTQGGLGPRISPCLEISSTPLHIAIIHRNESIVTQLTSDRRTWQLQPVAGSKGQLQLPADIDIDKSCYRRFTWPVGSDYSASIQTTASAIQLTVLVGNVPILQRLLKVEERRTRYTPGLPNFHLAAALGKPETVKVFLDSNDGNFDPLIQDSLKNTALHHALRGTQVKFYPHLVDFVSCRHVFRWRWNADWVSKWLANADDMTLLKQRTRKDKGKFKEKYGLRQGSINLLLEAGIDMWQRNSQHRTATPEHNAPEAFVTWWYDKVADETKNLQERLNAAANAISVTAALVATASYVGPLTPPRGYDERSGDLQVNLLAMRVFIVCDTLSFYLALGAIMLALIPALPLPQESMFNELVRTRFIVAGAVSFLCPSIICVLIAFSAGSTAVIPDDGLAYHGLTICTAAVGGFLCFMVLFGFLRRLLNVQQTLPWAKLIPYIGSLWKPILPLKPYIRKLTKRS